MKFDKNWKNTNLGVALTTVITGVVLVAILWHLPTVGRAVRTFLGFFRPVFIGIAIAYVLNPLVNKFQKHVFHKTPRKKLRQWLSILCTIAFVLLLVVLLMVFLIPQMISSISQFVSQLDNYVNSADRLMQRLFDFLGAHGINSSRIDEVISDLLAKLQSVLPSNVENVLSFVRNVGSHVFDGAVALVLAIYFLADKERLLSGMSQILRALLHRERYDKTMDFLKRGHSILIRYIVYDILDGFFIGFANFLFMLFAGLPYALLISLVVGVTNLAPTFGPIIGGAIGAILLLLINPWYAVYFLIFTVIIQIFDGYILKPRLFGDALGVPGVIVLVCVIVGGKMFGAWGVLLAIPFAAIAYYTIREAFSRQAAVA